MAQRSTLFPSLYDEVERSASHSSIFMMHFVRNGASPNPNPISVNDHRLSTHPSSQPITPLFFLTLPSYPLPLLLNSPSISQLLLSSQAFNHSSSLLCAYALQLWAKPTLLSNPPPRLVPPPPSAPALQIGAQNVGCDRFDSSRS